MLRNEIHKAHDKAGQYYGKQRYSVPAKNLGWDSYALFCAVRDEIQTEIEP